MIQLRPLASSHAEKKTEWVLFLNYINLTFTYININFFLFFRNSLGYRQNASNFYLENHEWQASINISSRNFANNGLLLSFYIQYPLIIWLVTVL